MKKGKTNFDNLIENISDFEKDADFEKTSKRQLVKWLREEIDNYENVKTKLVKRNKLMDIIVLVMQIAKRENMSLDDAWIRWWAKSRKYLK